MLLLAFGALVVGIEGLQRAVAWWQGATPEPLDGLLIASLPLLAWLWWRYLSPFGAGRGQCLDGACRAEHPPKT